MDNYMQGVDEAIEEALCDHVRPRVFLSLVEDAVKDAVRSPFTSNLYKYIIRTATYEASTMNYTEMCDYLKERDGEI